jgi:tetratricopeptide (TPR) repeat protein
VHPNKEINMRNIVLIALSVFSGLAAADQVENLTELALLPTYCRGTQQIRGISHDPKPIEEYLAIYGQPYYHLHHYCWALNTENKAGRISDRYLRESKLSYALGDIQYVLERSDPEFVFLPEIYNSQARILFTLRRDAEAVAALNKAIATKPDYVPAYLRLSDYLVDKGAKAEAIKILERGIDNTENATALTKRLAKLGKTYQGVPGNKRKTDDAPAPVTPGKSESQAESSEAKTPSSIPAQSSEQSSKGPYCRFCP